MFVCLFVYLYTYIYIYIYTYVYTHTYIYIFIERERETQREKYTRLLLLCCFTAVLLSWFTAVAVYTSTVVLIYYLCCFVGLPLADEYVCLVCLAPVCYSCLFVVLFYRWCANTCVLLLCVWLLNYVFVLLFPHRRRNTFILSSRACLVDHWLLCVCVDGGRTC